MSNKFIFNEDINKIITKRKSVRTYNTEKIPDEILNKLNEYIKSLSGPFDEKVVFTDNAPDASEYRKYYEEISPDNAEKIYRQVVKSERSTEKAKELATYYSNMEAASAAQTLQEMKEDLDLVCDIIENMPEKKAAAILQEMDSTFAAQISKKISAIDK